MKVVRYTFDVCIRSGYEGDVYTLAPKLKDGIMKVTDVCGCDISEHTHSSLFNCVDVDDVIEVQNATRRNVTSKEGGAKCK